MEKSTEYRYTGFFSYISIFILSALILMPVVVWRILIRVAEESGAKSVKLKGSDMIIQPGNKSISIMEGYQLSDLFFHVIIPLGIVAVFALVQKWDIRRFLGLHNFNRKRNFVYLVSALALISLLVIYVPPPDPDSTVMMQNILKENAIWKVILIAGILIPIVEEIFFRGLIYDYFNMIIKKLTPWAGVFISALLFSALHWQYNSGELIIIFIISLIMSLGRWYTGGLIIPILIHIFLNTTSTILFSMQL